MTYVNDNSLGGKLKPIHNNIELTKAMKSRRNCCLYTVGTFPINEENLYTLKINLNKVYKVGFPQILLFYFLCCLAALPVNDDSGI